MNGVLGQPGLFEIPPFVLCHQQEHTMSEQSAMTAEQFRSAAAAIEGQVGQVIVGQKGLVRQTLITLLAGGNALLEGVPGLGKTMLVRTMAQAVDCAFSRIQFTPDLMPADIVGTNLIVEDDQGRRQFQFEAGPVFANLVLADEINRATPKTQSAMLEAMQEHAVTSGGTRHPLPEPFMVLATQNPIEQEGTYPLPEAQLDRFFFKLLVPYSNREELHVILDRTTAGRDPQARPVIGGDQVLAAQKLVRRVIVAKHVQDYAVRLVLATHPNGEFAPSMISQFVRFGASPRGVQAVVLAGKVRALLDERYNVSFDDIVGSYLPALRHRILLNFEGQAEGIDTDEVLGTVLSEVPKTLSEELKAR
jgi:MoxR-like ATPase